MEPFQFSKEAQWLAMSCLQKSIRRGLPEVATAYADRMWDVSKSYLLYRLSIVALEDIGIANFPLVNSFLATEIKKDKIEQAGGKEYVLQVVADMANSPKDRSACDLTWLASGSLGGEPSSELSPLLEEVRSNWKVLGGKILKQDGVDIEKHDPESLAEHVKLVGASDEATLATLYGAKIQREPHCLAIGICERLMKDEEEINMGKWRTGDVINMPTQPDCYYHDEQAQTLWLNHGVDGHTREGQKALYAWLRMHPSYNFPIAKHLLFRVEGGEVSHRLFYPSAVNIMHWANAHHPELYGQDAVDGIKAFKQEFQSYEELRQRNIPWKMVRPAGFEPATPRL